MLFIMEGIDLAGVVDSDFQGIQINFAPPRPAGFANFRWAGQDLLFCGAGRGSPFSAGRGGAGCTSLVLRLDGREMTSSGIKQKRETQTDRQTEPSYSI